MDLPRDPAARLAQRTARLILLCDLYIALAWLLGSPRRTETATFKPARQAFQALPGDPAQAWGMALLVFTLIAALALVSRHECAVHAAFAVLTGYWCFWVFNDVYAAFQPYASLTAPGSVAIILLGHIRQSLTTLPLVHGRR